MIRDVLDLGALFGGAIALLGGAVIAIARSYDSALRRARRRPPVVIVALPRASVVHTRNKRSR
jgi:hypothetical protein